jgi:hypothetical protein
VPAFILQLHQYKIASLGARSEEKQQAHVKLGSRQEAGSSSALLIDHCHSYKSASQEEATTPPLL